MSDKAPQPTAKEIAAELLAGAEAADGQYVTVKREQLIQALKGDDAKPVKK